MELTKENLETMLNVADVFQEDCHEVVEMVMKMSKKEITSQDATNVWIFRKLAEFEFRLRKLEEK